MDMTVPAQDYCLGSEQCAESPENAGFTPNLAALLDYFPHEIIRHGCWLLLGSTLVCFRPLPICSILQKRGSQNWAAHGAAIQNASFKGKIATAPLCLISLLRKQPNPLKVCHQFIPFCSSTIAVRALTASFFILAILQHAREKLPYLLLFTLISKDLK